MPGSWAQGNLQRAKNAMDAYARGAEAKQRGQQGLFNALSQVGQIGFTGLQNKLQRQHEVDLQKLKAKIEAWAADEAAGQPKGYMPAEPMPGQTTGEAAGMPQTPEYSKAQQEMMRMGINPGWQTKQAVETSNYQTALKTAKDMWGAKWDTLSPSQQRFEVVSILHGHYYAPTTGTDKKEWDDQETLYWTITNMRDWGQNSEKGRQYSSMDEQGNYIISGKNADAAGVVLDELYNRSRLVPQLKKKYPTREIFNQFMRPLVENQLGKPLPGSEQGGGGQQGGGANDFKNAERDELDKLLPYLDKYGNQQDVSDAVSGINERRTMAGGGIGTLAIELGKMTGLNNYIISDQRLRELLNKARAIKAQIESEGQSQYQKKNKYMQDYANQFKK